MYLKLENALYIKGIENTLQMKKKNKSPLLLLNSFRLINSLNPKFQSDSKKKITSKTNDTITDTIKEKISQNGRFNFFNNFIKIKPHKQRLIIFNTIILNSLYFLLDRYYTLSVNTNIYLKPIANSKATT